MDTSRHAKTRMLSGCLAMLDTIASSRENPCSGQVEAVRKRVAWPGSVLRSAGREQNCRYINGSPDRQLEARHKTFWKRSGRAI